MPMLKILNEREYEDYYKSQILEKHQPLCEVPYSTEKKVY